MSAWYGIVSCSCI